MLNLARLAALLTPEQYTAIIAVLERRDDTLEGFKLLRKDYSGVKSRVRKHEKRMLDMIKHEGESFATTVVQNEIGYIENKYPAIEKSIRRYHEAMKNFDTMCNSPHIAQYLSNNSWSDFDNFKNCLNQADKHIDEAVDSIRITERYFKNINAMLKGHTELTALKRAKAILHIYSKPSAQ